MPYQKHYNPEPLELRELTGLQLTILTFITRHKYARRSHTQLFIGKSLRWTQLQLQLLTRAGLVKRMREPFDPEAARILGSRDKIYRITETGKLAVADHLQIDPSYLHVVGANKSIPHQLERTRFLTPIEITCRTGRYRYIDAPQLVRESSRKHTSSHNPYSWDVSSGSETRTLIPDKLCAIDDIADGRQHKRAVRALEVDMGTEPETSNNWNRESIEKKVVLMGLTYKRGLHQKIFHTNDFKVPILTTTARRAGNILGVIRDFSAKYSFPPEMFLVTTHQDYDPESILNHEYRVWTRRGKGNRLTEGESVATLLG